MGRLLVEDVARAREVRALVLRCCPWAQHRRVTKKAVARAGGGRMIKALELMEVSLVTLPMHPGARVTSAKSAVAAPDRSRHPPRHGADRSEDLMRHHSPAHFRAIELKDAGEGEMTC